MKYLSYQKMKNRFLKLRKYCVFSYKKIITLIFFYFLFLFTTLWYDEAFRTESLQGQLPQKKILMISETFFSRSTVDCFRGFMSSSHIALWNFLRESTLKLWMILTAIKKLILPVEHPIQAFYWALVFAVFLDLW